MAIWVNQIKIIFYRTYCYIKGIGCIKDTGIYLVRLICNNNNATVIMHIQKNVLASLLYDLSPLGESPLKI